MGQVAQEEEKELPTLTQSVAGMVSAECVVGVVAATLRDRLTAGGVEGPHLALHPHPQVSIAVHLQHLSCLAQCLVSQTQNTGLLSI